MNRNHLYWASVLVTYCISVVIVGYFFTHDMYGGLICATPCMLLGFLIGAALDGYISSTYPEFLYTPYKDMRTLARVRQKKRKELQDTMLFKMQYMQGLERTIAELNEIFKANRKFKLTRWIVFRAWYKAQIDHMVLHPDIYGLSLNSEPYKKENDPLYDPNAPDWAIYDRDHYYDDDDDDDFDDDDDENDDFEDYSNKDKKSKFSDAFAIGMGIGIINGLTGGSVFGGGSGGN